MSSPGPLTRSSLRRRVADAILVTQDRYQWIESAYHVDLVGQDPRVAAHLSFGVGILTTIPANLDRQRTAVGTVASTGVLVRFVHQMRPDSQIADYGSALDAGEAMVAACMALETDPSLSITLSQYRTPRLAGDGTYLLSDVEFLCLHRTALS